MAAENNLFTIGGLLILQINNFTAEKVTSLDPTDTSSAIFNIPTIILAHPYNSSITNVNYLNSSLIFMKISALTGPAPVTKYFTFENMSFSGWYFESQNSIIRLTNLLNDLDIIIAFNKLTFKNIYFKAKGNLMNLGHQFPNNVTISDSSFLNISHGNILVTSSNLQNSKLLTHVSFNGWTFEGIEAESNSFIEVREGGRVYISLSNFTNMNSYLSGGVISGGSKGTITIIMDSIFKNNSAFSGGVLNVEQESVIKLFNWTITENFAITSGVVNVQQDGQFEFYNSQIYNNYAYNNPISQMLDSALTSIIDHWEIYQNEVINKPQLDDELNATCFKLWFLSQNFIEFLKTNYISALSEIGVESVFQLISASLKIRNNTKIFKQDSILKAFISEVSVTNSVIYDINITKISIEIVSSKLALSDITVYNIINPKQKEFLLIFLDSQLSINNLAYSNSSSILFNCQKSSVDALSIYLSNITDATNLFIISDSYNISLNQIITTDVQVLNPELYTITKSTNTSLIGFKTSGVMKIVLNIGSSFINKVEDFELK